MLAGLAEVRSLRGQLASLGLDDNARFEIDYRLETKEEQFQKAAVLAQGVRIDVLADDGLVFGGQPVRVQTIVANRGDSDLSVKSISLSGFEGDASCAAAVVKGGAVMPRCDANVKIPAGARLTSPTGTRWRTRRATNSTPTRRSGCRSGRRRSAPGFVLDMGGAEVCVDQPVQYRYEGNIFSGEKRTELLVVPRLSVTVTPDDRHRPRAPRAGPRPPAPRRPTGRSG